MNTLSTNKEKIDIAIKEIQEIMLPVKIYLTTHHENTTSVNHYKTNGIKIAMNLLCSEENLTQENIMVAYLETMSSKATGGLPDFMIKPKEEEQLLLGKNKQSLSKHFIDTLHSFLQNRNWSEAQKKVDILIQYVIGFGEKIEKKQKNDQIIEKKKHDKTNRLYRQVQNTISDLPDEFKTNKGKKMTTRAVPEGFCYKKLFESKMIPQEYLKQREVLKRILSDAFLDCLYHIKDVIRSGIKYEELTDSEIKSIVLAAFQNGVLSEASRQSTEIKKLHQSLSKKGPGNTDIVHIPLSAYSRLPKTLASGRNKILKLPSLGKGFLYFAIQKSIEREGRKKTQLGFVRHQKQKKAFTASIKDENTITRKIGNETITEDEGIKIIQNKHSDISMIVYQGVLDSIPMLISGNYHIGSERGMREDIEHIVDLRLKKNNIESTSIKQNIINNRITGDEPTEKEVPSIATSIEQYKANIANDLHPVAISHGAPSLNEILLNEYPREIITATLTDPLGYHHPDQETKNRRFEEKHGL